LGNHTGTTEWGNTPWKEVPKQIAFTYREHIVLRLDVTTAGSKFSKAPTYFSSIQTSHGASWQVLGGHFIHHPTATGFRIYISSQISGVLQSKHKWSVGWLGTTVTQSGIRNLKWESRLHDAASRSIDGLGQQLYGIVDTSSSNFMDTPAYITSLVDNNRYCVDEVLQPLASVTYFVLLVSLAKICTDPT
jgi:hypothetical protein